MTFDLWNVAAVVAVVYGVRAAVTALAVVVREVFLQFGREHVVTVYAGNGSAVYRTKGFVHNGEFVEAATGQRIEVHGSYTVRCVG